METQETTAVAVTPRSVGVRFGLIGGLISIFYFLVLNISGIDMTQGVWNWVGYAVTLALVIFAQLNYKSRGDGFMSYGQGIGIAFWMALISSVISSVFTYIYIKFIDGGFLDIMRDKQIETWQAQGMSDAQIDQALEFSSKFMTAEVVPLFMLVGGIVVTLIIALIVTIFTQKTNPQPAF